MQRRAWIWTTAAAACTLILAYAAIGIYFSWNEEYVPYMPILWDGNRYVQRPDMLTRDHTIRMLIYTDPEDYFAIDQDENLWVRRKLARDPDLLHNFVSKAENISAETVAKHESRVLTRWRKPA